MTSSSTDENTPADKKLTDAERKKKVSKWMMKPEVTSAAVVDAFAKNYSEELAFGDVVEVISDATKELINTDSMQYVERLLLSQSIALNGLFVSLARKASGQEYVKQYEVFLRLALKAQSQCRATLETLATVKNPPVYANTANIAQNQQINNGAPPAQQMQPNQQPAITSDQGAPVPSKIRAKSRAAS